MVGKHWHHPSGNNLREIPITEDITDPNTTPDHLDEVVDRDRMMVSVYSAINRLSPRQRHIIHYRYGLLDGGIYTYHEISAILGISEKQIRFLETTAINQLRQYLTPDAIIQQARLYFLKLLYMDDCSYRLESWDA